MHEYIPELRAQYRAGEISRREFMRTATLLGVSVGGGGPMIGARRAPRPVPTRRSRAGCSASPAASRR